MKESKAKILSCPVLSDIPESTRLSEVYRTLPICPSDKSTLRVNIKHLWKNTDGEKTEVMGEKNLFHFHFFQHKIYRFWPGIEIEPVSLEISEKSPAPLRGYAVSKITELHTV
jgi:hypothetical protein